VLQSPSYHLSFDWFPNILHPAAGLNSEHLKRLAISAEDSLQGYRTSCEYLAS
jgi:hypothetical protein